MLPPSTRAGLAVYRCEPTCDSDGACLGGTDHFCDARPDAAGLPVSVCTPRGKLLGEDWCRVDADCRSGACEGGACR